MEKSEIEALKKEFCCPFCKGTGKRDKFTSTASVFSNEDPSTWFTKVAKQQPCTVCDATGYSNPLIKKLFDHIESHQITVNTQQSDSELVEIENNLYEWLDEMEFHNIGEAVGYLNQGWGVPFALQNALEFIINGLIRELT